MQLAILLFGELQVNQLIKKWEQLFYLRQPGYGTSYVTGKIQFDALIAAYGRAAEARGERPFPYRCCFGR